MVFVVEVLKMEMKIVDVWMVLVMVFVFLVFFGCLFTPRRVTILVIVEEMFKRCFSTLLKLIFR